MAFQENMTQELALVGQIAPASFSAGTTEISAIDMSYFRRIMFVIQCGVLTSATVDFKVKACATSGGTYVDVAGPLSITQITTSTKIAELEVKDETLAAASSTAGVSYRFVGGRLTVGGTSALVAVTVWGSVARSKPLTPQNLAAVTQVVVY
jgi:hypothetical protein